MSTTLDLGCGPNPQNPFQADQVFGVDIQTYENPNIKIADLVVEKIPFEDNTFDYITGFDFLEHIPRVIYINGERRQPFIEVMSEVARVMKPGGETFFATPAYPHPEAFQDPQHTNVITEETIQYFAGYHLDLNHGYGFKGNFEVVQHVWANTPIKIIGDSFYKIVPFHLIWHLEVVK